MKILTIGRKDADIVLTDPQQQVSRLHAELTIAEDGSYYLTDCGSSNGTFVKRNNEWQSIRQEYGKRHRRDRSAATMKRRARAGSTIEPALTICEINLSFHTKT
jgi:hypothetical protein